MNFVRETNADLKNVALDGRKITGAEDFELLFVTLGNADNHILNECAGKSVHSVRDARIVQLLDNEFIAVLFDPDFRTERLAQLAFGSLDRELAIVFDFGGNAGGQNDRFLSNSRHIRLLSAETC